jgi:uncharacterized protein with HEPN domain
MLQKYVEGVSFEAFWDDSEKRDAVAMRLSVIGEAARHVTPATASKLPAIPFPAVRGLRNRIAHDYKRVNYRVVWEVTQEDIGPLAVALEKYFAENPS